MESNTIDVRKVSDEDSNALPLLRGPQPDRLVVTAADEVVTLAGKLHRPDGIHVTLKKTIRLKAEASKAIINKFVFILE